MTEIKIKNLPLLILLVMILIGAPIIFWYQFKKSAEPIKIEKTNSGLFSFNESAFKATDTEKKSEFEEKLIQLVPASHKLKTKHFYAPGISYLVAAATVMNFYDSSIDLKKAVVYSRSTRFIYPSEEERLKGKGDVGPSAPNMSLTEVFKNLGFVTYIGFDKNKNGLVKEFLKEVPSENQREFTDQEEAFYFLKKLIASGFPVITHIDLGKLTFTEKEGSNFIPVFGFDRDNIYTYFSFDKSGKEIKIANNQFLDAWDESEGKGFFGPNFFIWLEESQEGLSDSAILRILKKDAQEAIQNMKNFVEDIKKGVSIPYLIWDSGYWTRRFSALFLKENNLDNVAEKYTQAAEIYKEINENTSKDEFIEKMKKIVQLEEEAVQLWKD